MAVRWLDQWPIHTPPAASVPALAPIWQRWMTSLVLAVNGTIVGEGNPEGVVSAPQGTIFRRTDGGVGTSLYVKEAGGATQPFTNTGWGAK